MNTHHYRITCLQAPGTNTETHLPQVPKPLDKITRKHGALEYPVVEVSHASQSRAFDQPRAPALPLHCRCKLFAICWGLGISTCTLRDFTNLP